MFLQFVLALKMLLAFTLSVCRRFSRILLYAESFHSQGSLSIVGAEVNEAGTPGRKTRFQSGIAAFLCQICRFISLRVIPAKC